MSFWDDVIIGEGSKGCSSIIVREVGEVSIYHNNVSYWISRVFLDLGMTVFKNTGEGQTIKCLLDGKAEDETIRLYLVELLLAHVGPTKLQSAVESALKKAFNAGLESKAEEIRNALGLS